MPGEAFSRTRRKRCHASRFASGRFCPDCSGVPEMLFGPASHSGAAAEQAARIRRRIRAGFPLDIIVRSPAAIRKRTAMGDGFIREILEKGKVLHESHDV